MITTTAGKSLLGVYSELGFSGKGGQTSSGLGKFHLALNCISLKWGKSREILEHGSADNMAPPQTYNLIQGWMMSKANQKRSQAALPEDSGWQTPLADSTSLWTCRKSGLLSKSLMTPYTSLIPPSKGCLCYSDIWEMNLFQYLTFIHNA